MAESPAFQPLFAKIAESGRRARALRRSHDYATRDEARRLAKELSTTKVPKLAVLSSHDFESNAAPTRGGKNYTL